MDYCIGYTFSSFGSIIINYDYSLISHIAPESFREPSKVLINGTAEDIIFRELPDYSCVV